MLNKLVWITGEAQNEWVEKILKLRQYLWPDYQRLDRDTILKLYTHYPMYQWLAQDNGEVIACINSLPVAFNQSFNELPQEGLNWVLSHLDSSTQGTKANCLAAVSATVNPSHQGLGLSKLLLNRLKSIANEVQYKALVVPARPSKKEKYPLISMKDYLQWKRKDNYSFDPWLRTHEQLGGKIAHPCNQSRFIKASIKQWEQWLGYSLHQTGQYLIQAGLNPVSINIEADTGIYIEPNVWVIYQF